MSTQTLMEFPAEVAIRAMGLNEDDFEALIASLILPLIEPAAASISIASSRSGKYLSVRVHFTAASIEQMECIYSALKAESRVLYTL